MGKTILIASDSELREMYESQRMTMKQIAEKYGCSPAAVCVRMKKAGIESRTVSDYAKPKVKTKKERENAWRNSEIEYLVRNYSTTPNHILEDNLPRRTKIGIYKKARKLGLRPSKEKIFADRSYRERNEANSNWKGGRKRTSKGYVEVLMPGHHRADKCGYVMEHLLVAEAKYGREISRNEAVHHINGIKDDNRPENLVVMPFGEHSALHNHLRYLEKQKATERK